MIELVVIFLKKMKIALGADHAGFALKEYLKDKLIRQGHEVIDYGAFGAESSDYPDFAAPVARDVAAGRADRGVLVCSTGIGMAIAANKVCGVRAALATNLDEVRLVRSHNDANVLTFGARYTTPEEAEAMLEAFLATGFEGGRHARRVGKIEEIERESAGDKK